MKKSHNLKREQAHKAVVNVLLKVIKLDQTEIFKNTISNARNRNSQWGKKALWYGIWM